MKQVKIIIEKHPGPESLDSEEPVIEAFIAEATV